MGNIRTRRDQMRIQGSGSVKKSYRSERRQKVPNHCTSGLSHVKVLSSEIDMITSDIIERSSLRGEAQKFAADFSHPYTCERSFK
jgi:hypothetical protein